MLIATVVGTRPQFIKSSSISLAVDKAQKAGEDISELLIHTGQHYDEEMSDLFFQEMGLRSDHIRLNIGSGSHGEQTGKILVELEKIFLEHNPDLVLVYGDCNSTIAGALAAAKLNIPVFHVEAGLRSGNLAMPEELNRITTDAISEVLYCPTELAMQNLEECGLARRSRFVGDVMYDVALQFLEKTKEREGEILSKYKVHSGKYILATVHRAENTNDPDQLNETFKALTEISKSYRVVLPLHPRTRDKIRDHGIVIQSDDIGIIPPISYVEMLHMTRNAALILTDSGGLQKEAFFHGVPCVTLRDETEWVETVDAGWNVIAGQETKSLQALIQQQLTRKDLQHDFYPYGKGDAGDLIIRDILSWNREMRNSKNG